MDAILAVVIVSCVMSLAFGCIATLLSVLESDRSGYGVLDDGMYIRVKKWAARLIGIGLLLGAVAVFVPTTNQLAAIYVIPAVANSEKIQGEADEIYGLAKQWLQQQAKKDGTGNAVGVESDK
jgi:hypothetical protein